MTMRLEESRSSILHDRACKMRLTVTRSARSSRGHKSFNICDSIVAGRASNKLRTRFAELSRHITRRMTTIPMEEKIPPARPILIQAGKRAIRNELYRCKWKIWFDASRIIKRSPSSSSFFFFTRIFENFLSRSFSFRDSLLPFPRDRRSISHILKNYK